jgi:membrane-associated phospholipid phosphatase
LKTEDTRVAFPLRRWSVTLPLASVLWYIGLHSRPWTINPRCADVPSACDVTEIPWWEHPTTGIHFAWADDWSFHTQHSAGAIAFFLILCLAIKKSPFLAVRPVVHRLRFFGGLFFGLVTATVANGLLTETIRLIVQRPRPFVYEDLPGHGAIVANYSSFVSGHTSFTAAMAGSVFWILARGYSLDGAQAMDLKRGIRSPWFWIAVLVCLATATFRVLAGRHFVSDTLGGMAAGAIVAWWVWRKSATN